MENNPYQAPQSKLDIPLKANDFSAVGQAVSVGIGRGAGWIGDAWRLMKPDLGTWVLITLFMFATLIGLVFLLGISAGVMMGLGGGFDAETMNHMASNDAATGFSIASALVSIPVNIISLLLSAGLLMGLKERYSGGSLNFSHLFAAFKKQTKPIIILALIYSAVGIVIQIISSLLMDPQNPNLIGSIIVIALTILSILPFAFALPLVSLSNMPVINAIQLSISGVLKNILPLLINYFLLMLLFILGAIPIGLGLLIVIPLFYANTFVSYKEIFIKDQFSA